ncbi:hypothetical protein O6H91_10G094500 [Diphasiastrum complanatum]|uniref:Uncharacterized protein n=3 Tax=Diphasiastrum complanatum TaxID=34168 RepID=A0ACC2CJP1_DIPCM|nr:hypothetical protein O6H91_10G094500 [Diphasiastrum complanatum]KAJ7542209.1 hypothetical protein O6H91_10G094500 [Diphasiastrum complanatum]KAJ7542210.1 hypothetical protein O6H91_10G094500 [Diphasiastrum complanatum]
MSLTRFCSAPVTRRSLRELYIGFTGLLALIFIRSFIVHISVSSNPREFKTAIRQSSTTNNYQHAKIRKVDPVPSHIMQIHNPSSGGSWMREKGTLETQYESMLTLDEVWKGKEKSTVVSLNFSISKKPDGSQRASSEESQDSLKRGNKENKERKTDKYNNDGDETKESSQITATQSSKTSYADGNKKAVTQSDQPPNFREKEVRVSKYAPKYIEDQSRSSLDTKEDLDSVELLRISRIPKARKRRERLKLNWKMIRVLQTDHRSEQFSHRLKDFFVSCKCSARFFMTWFSPASTFGPRERISLESIFKFHPLACVVIVSRSLDTKQGDRILKPFVDAGYQVMAAAPNLPFLFRNTSAEIWFRNLRQGKVDPGAVSLSQNLSNLLRLAVLYKFGGIYVDTDVIALRDFSSLSNSIGAQSTEASGQWNRLNNAVLIFDRSHPILLQIIRNFTNEFDGSKWGHNGPYLVSRVVRKLISDTDSSSFSFTILPPSALYPATWHHIGRWFLAPKHEMEREWKSAKLQELQLETYAVHLWNRQTKMLVIERDSILAELFHRCCIFCNNQTESALLTSTGS